MKGKSEQTAGVSKFTVKFLDLLVEHGLAASDVPEELKGKPVHIPQVNFTVPLKKQIQAKMGPPPYAMRAKLVEDLTEQLLKALGEQWRKVAEQCRSHPEHFARIWQAVVETIDLTELNKLIQDHNTFYPIEANLQFDPETGKYMLGATPWKPKPKITPASLLQQFPPDLQAALAPPSS